MVAADVAPTGRMEGERVMGPTAGLFTVSTTAADLPPPGAGLTAVSEREPAAEKSAAVKAAVTWVAFT